jgi:hypothetical protein
MWMRSHGSFLKEESRVLFKTPPTNNRKRALAESQALTDPSI